MNLPKYNKTKLATMLKTLKANQTKTKSSEHFL